MGSADDDGTLELYRPGTRQRTNSLTQLREWVVVEGNRIVIATLLTAAVFVLFLSLNELDIIAFVNDDSVTRLAGGMIAGTFSLVTLVVSVNQLILSQEFSMAGEARDEFSGVIDFRRDIEDQTDVPAAPVSPTKLLELLVEAINYRAHDLADAVADHEDDEFVDVVQRYVNTVDERTTRIDKTLEHTTFGTFKALSAAVGYDDVWQLYLARHLRGSRESLSDEALAAFDDLIDALRLFDAAREQFKTTYLQRELTRFSQLTIYSGVPAILAALTTGFLYADFTGPSISVVYLPYIVSALVAVVISPLALLASYILRTATVTRRTASVGPILPQKDPDTGPFEVTHERDE